MYTSFIKIKNRKLSKVLLLFLSTLILSFFHTNLKAADGCYVGGVLYTSHTKSGKFFNRSPGDLDADCGVTGTISGSCRLYNGGPIILNSSYTNYSNSYSANISVIDCALDNEIWLLLLALSLGFVLKFRSNLT